MQKEVVTRTVQDQSQPFFQKMEERFVKIRERAHELFKTKGAYDGGDLEDWLRAERDLFFVPQSELKESEASYELRMAVPGFAVNDISIAVESNQLIIHGQTKKHTEDRKDGAILVSEFSSKELFRRFFLNNPVQLDKVRATLEDGILQIQLPKSTQEADKTGIKRVDVASSPPGKESKAAHAA